MGSFFHDLSTLALLFALNGASTTEQQQNYLPKRALVAARLPR